MGISTGVFQGTAITAGGPTQDLVDPAMTDTPKAAIFAVTLAITNGTLANGSLLSLGMTDGTDHYCQVSGSEDTGGVTNSWNRGKVGPLIQIINLTTGVVIAEASFVAFIAGGVRILWDTTTFVLPAAAYKLECAFFGGSDLTVGVRRITSSGALNGGTFTLGVGLRADDMFFIGHRRGFDDVSRTSSATIVGVASYQQADGDIDQGCTSFGDSDAAATGDPWMFVSPSRVFKTTTSGAQGVGLEVIGVSALNNGTIVTKNRDTSSTGEAMVCLALNYNGVVQHRVSQQFSPTVAGATNHTIGFTPQFLMVLPSLVATQDTTIVAATGGATGIGFCTATAAAAAGISVQDAALANTGSRSRAGLIDCPLDTGALGIRAILTSFGDPTVINYQNVLATTGILTFWAIGSTFANLTLDTAPLAFVVNPPSIVLNRIFNIEGGAHLAVWAINPPDLAVAVVGSFSLTLEPLALALALPARSLQVDGPVFSDNRAGKQVFAGAQRAQASFAGAVAAQAGIAK